jgi:hypothetical protein
VRYFAGSAPEFATSTPTQNELPAYFNTGFFTVTPSLAAATFPTSLPGVVRGDEGVDEAAPDVAGAAGTPVVVAAAARGFPSVQPVTANIADSVTAVSVNVVPRLAVR